MVVMRILMIVVAMIAAAHVVVMALLRRADRFGVADDPRAVFAQLAVHLGLAGGEFVDPVDKRIDHPGMVAQVACLDEFDRRACVLRSAPSRLRPFPLRRRARALTRR